MHKTPKRKKDFHEEDSQSDSDFPRRQRAKRLNQQRHISRSIDSLSDLESDSSVAITGNNGSGVFASSTRTPMSSRGRSLSVDSVPGSILSDHGATPHTQATEPSQAFRGVLLPSAGQPRTLPLDPVYRPLRSEVAETHDLHVPGETKSTRTKLPVRFLDDFTVYDGNGTYLPFALVAASLLSTASQGCIRASGLVSRCLEEFEDGDSDISEAELQPLVSLKPFKDFWTDYDTSELDGVWGARTVGVATEHGWYILQQPSALYMTYYQPFWLSHHLTWLAARAIRNDPSISLKNFRRQIECQNDDEAVLIMGRELVKTDITDSVILYMKDQLLSQQYVHDCNTLLQSPLLQHVIYRAEMIGQTLQQFLHLDEFHRSISVMPNPDTGNVMSDKAITITMPLVHELTTGLFLKTLLKAGKTLDSCDYSNKLLEDPGVPDILHPDRPSNVDWESAVNDFPGYFGRVSLDGETYSVGDVIMVNPGKDDLIHRAKSALETCSQSWKNKFVNKVWFCRIIYMFDLVSSKRQTSEPTAHVQWYEHGSRTILQETAHPYGLFALAECANIPIGSILGPCVVKYLKPGDAEPQKYHCSFLWDASEARFLDQAKLQDSGFTKGHPHCPCCNLNDKRNRDTSHECFLHSETFGEVRGIEYHKDDFVYVSAKPNYPYLIGQVRRFIVDGEYTVDNSSVELTLLGRFDDVARAVGRSEVRQDETRLFLTNEVKTYPLSLIEGKCFVVGKGLVASRDLTDHFYVDLWAPKLNVRCLEDFRSLKHRKLAVCKPCMRSVKREQDNIRAYRACNPPLKTMELFAAFNQLKPVETAGAGGLSTGLEQSGFVKTYWAIEILPGAAATFQANHPGAVVYNQDTNVCLQYAINAREGKVCDPLKCLGTGRQLPPMPQCGDVELITGGFPCQSFSGLNHQRHKSHEDIRTTLVANMLSYVEFYRPRYVLMENVKGLLQHHSQYSASEADGDDDEEKIIKMSIVKFVLRALLCLGYQTQFKVLQAADYGSPQRRERVIFWAARRSELLPEFPFPTHVAPRYKSSVLSLPTHDKLNPVQRSDMNCAPFRALCVRDAISDLPGFDWKNPRVICSNGEDAAEIMRPRVKYTERSAVSTPSRKLVGFLEPVNYATPPRTVYQRILRGDEDQVTLHCSRTFKAPIVERVWHVCRRDVKGPHDLPYELWPPALRKVSRNATMLSSKWQNQYSRLKWKEPFNTALTKSRPFSKGSKVLHPQQRRVITARECARSQGFPDSYEFVQEDEDGGPTAWARLLDDIYKQIGNAVPVPLAYVLGKSLGKALVDKWLQERSEEPEGLENTSSDDNFSGSVSEVSSEGTCSEIL